MEYVDFIGEEAFENENIFDENDTEAENDENQSLKAGKKPKNDTDVLKSVWEKSENATVKQKHTVNSRPRPKFTERELTSKKGLPALKKMFDNFKVDDKLGPYENMNQVLSKMEYWGHRLFPQLNFDDFLEKAEIIGRKRLVRVSLYKMRQGMSLDDDNAVIDTKTETAQNEKEKPIENEKTAEELFDEQFVDDFYNDDFII